MKDSNPPKYALKFFRWYCSEERQEELEGDLLEQFEIDKELKRKFPSIRFWWNVMMCARSYAYKEEKSYLSNNQLPMIKSSLLSIYRGFKKNPLHGSLNILGLSLAFAIFSLLTVYIHYEINYERFHDKADKIYRVSYKTESENNVTQWARVPVSYVNKLPDEISGIKTLIRFQNNERKYLKIGQRKYREDNVYQTDGDVFDVFSFHLLEGDPKTALLNPKSIVLTETLAKKYFGQEIALGKEVLLSGEWNPESETYKVTGVMKDLPPNTHLPVNMLISFNSEEERTWWGYTYIMLENGVKPTQLIDPIQEFVDNHSDSKNKNESFVLQPMNDIHLTSNLAREIIPNGSLQNVKIFGAISLLILLIGLINFTNLNSVIYLSKFKEVGMRKVLGAGGKEISMNAILESILYSIVSLILGVLIAYLLYPYFETLSGSKMLMSPINFSVIVMSVALFIGAFAGIYPAIMAAKFQPIFLIQKNISNRNSSNSSVFSLKKIMLTIQFSITLLLIGCALISTDQFTFLGKQNLAMKPEQVLTLPRVPNFVKDNYQLFKSRLENVPGVNSISACLEVPSREIRDQGAFVLSGVHATSEEAPLVDIQVIGHEFFDVMNINLVAGGFFPDYIKSHSYPEFTEEYTYVDYLVEQKRAYLINETAMKLLGFEDPSEIIGLSGSFDQSWMKLANGPVMGVVEDYHQASLKNKIDPTIYVYEPLWLNTILMRIESANIVETIEKIESEWNGLFPNFKMEPQFLDELYNQLYYKERKQLELLYIFSIMAVLIACLGIFTLVAYALKTKTKEYAIRRVLGAKLSSLLAITGRDYAVLLLIGLFISIPITFYVMDAWLNNFAYRVAISPHNFSIAFIAMVILIGITVGYQTLKATEKNPVDSLGLD